jgi:hypothetical protein
MGFCSAGYTSRMYDLVRSFAGAAPNLDDILLRLDDGRARVDCSPARTRPRSAGEARFRLRRGEQRLHVLGFELADHRIGLVVVCGDDLGGLLFRVVKRPAADPEIDDFMTDPRSRPG